MSRATQRLIELVNRLFTPPNVYFEKLARSEAEAFEYALRAGQVVYQQFHGFNDLRGQAVLDFGCGRGGKTVYYATRGPRRTIGVDRGGGWEYALGQARSRHLKVEFRALAEDGRIDLPDDTCDVVMSSSVLEHVADLPLTFAELRRVLKPDGLLLNRWHPFRTRYGAHIHSAIGIPFAHLLFDEAEVVRAYCRALAQRFRKVPPTMQPAYATSTSLDRLEFFLNRKTVRQMRLALELAGFELLERRFLWGRREIRLAKHVPERYVDYAIDYEVRICANRKPSAVASRAAALRRSLGSLRDAVRPPGRAPVAGSPSVASRGAAGSTRVGEGIVP